MKKVAIYCRTSTDKQSKGLEAQRMALVDYVKSKGIKSYKVFSDSNQSGGKASRPALDSMLEKVRGGEFDTVICYSFSRFARSTKQLLEALSEFQDLGINFVSITEQIDTSTPMGKLVFTFVSALAEFEKELIRSRVMTGLAAARQKGKQLGRPKKRNSELIQELLKQGFTYSKISELSGCSHWGIAQEVKKLKSLKTSPTPISKKKVAL